MAARSRSSVKIVHICGTEQFKKGEKASGRDKKTNKPTFTRDQVEDSEERFTFDGYPIKE